MDGGRAGTCGSTGCDRVSAELMRDLESLLERFEERERESAANPGEYSEGARDAWDLAEGELEALLDMHRSGWTGPPCLMCGGVGKCAMAGVWPAPTATPAWLPCAEVEYDRARSNWEPDGLEPADLQVVIE